jgi:hypothetical protein
MRPARIVGPGSRAGKRRAAYFDGVSMSITALHEPSAWGR